MLSPKQFVQDHLQKLNCYLTGVTSSGITAGKYERLAVERFISCKSKYQYKESEVKRVFKFCSLLCAVQGNTLKQIELLDWWCFVIANIYGLYKEDGCRLIQSCYLEVSKKNAKSFLASLLAIYESIADNDLNAHVIVVSASGEQARICLDYTKGIINNSPIISSQFKLQRNILINRDQIGTNKIEIKANNPEKLNGYACSTIILDEYAFWKNGDARNNLQTGMIHRKNKLEIIITTASSIKLTNPALELRKTCANILDGQVQDDSQFTIIFTLDNKDEIENPSMWRKSNPSINKTIHLKDLKEQYEKAKLNNSTLYTFYTYHLNLWQDSLIDQFIKDEVIVSCMRDNVQIPKGSTIVLGGDFSSTKDLSSLCALWFDPGNKRFVSKNWFFFPNCQENMVKAGSVDLRFFIKDGYVIQSQKESLDEEQLLGVLKEINANYQVVSFGVDPAHAQLLMQRVTNELDLNVNFIPQNWRHLNEPLRQTEIHILNGSFQMDFNPCQRYNWQNVKLYVDSNGNRKILKQQGNSVDGCIALVNAMHEYLAYTDESFVKSFELYQDYYNKINK